MPKKKGAEPPNPLQTKKPKVKTYQNHSILKNSEILNNTKLN